MHHTCQIYTIDIYILDYTIYTTSKLRLHLSRENFRLWSLILKKMREMRKWMKEFESLFVFCVSEKMLKGSERKRERERERERVCVCVCGVWFWKRREKWENERSVWKFVFVVCEWNNVEGEWKKKFVCVFVCVCVCVCVKNWEECVCVVCDWESEKKSEKKFLEMCVCECVCEKMKKKCVKVCVCCLWLRKCGKNEKFFLVFYFNDLIIF